MTDRALLEAAARAAGIDLTAASWGGGQDGFYWVIEDQPGRVEYWAPLTDDGDALRLAVKLGICLDIMHGPKIHRIGAGPDIYNCTAAEYFGGMEPYAATRRAIVRAAAAMAKEPT